MFLNRQAPTINKHFGVQEIGFFPRGSPAGYPTQKVYVYVYVYVVVVVVIVVLL